MVCVPSVRGSEIAAGASQAGTVQITTAHSSEGSKGRQKTQNTYSLPQQENQHRPPQSR